MKRGAHSTTFFRCPGLGGLNVGVGFLKNVLPNKRVPNQAKTPQSVKLSRLKVNAIPVLGS